MGKESRSLLPGMGVVVPGQGAVRFSLTVYLTTVTHPDSAPIRTHAILANDILTGIQNRVSGTATDAGKCSRPKQHGPNNRPTVERRKRTTSTD